MVLETRKSHDLQSTSWKTRRAGGVGQTEPKELITGEEAEEGEAEEGGR